MKTKKREGRVIYTSDSAILSTISSKTDIKVADVPSFIFKDRSLSVLEVMVEYLKDIKKYSFHEIALALNRDDRTVWTVYHRVKQKRKNTLSK